MNRSVEKRTVIITGASDGLGAAIQETARRAGFQTVNIARRPHSQATHNIQADLSTVEGVFQAVADLQKLNCTPAAIIFNAGVLSVEPIAHISISEYERVMNLNLRAPLLMASRLYDWLREHGADIVMMNAISAQRAYTGQAVYDVSKWALRGLTEDLRLELAGTPCRVIGVYPGMLDTNMATKMPSPLPNSTSPTIPAQELAEMVINAIQLPKQMAVEDIIIDRRKFPKRKDGDE